LSWEFIGELPRLEKALAIRAARGRIEARPSILRNAFPAAAMAAE
jgi:hypothetical protein